MEVVDRRTDQHGIPLTAPERRSEFELTVAPGTQLTLSAEGRRLDATGHLQYRRLSETAPVRVRQRWTLEVDLSDGTSGRYQGQSLAPPDDTSGQSGSLPLDDLRALRMLLGQDATNKLVGTGRLTIELAEADGLDVATLAALSNAVSVPVVIAVEADIP